MKKKIVVLLSLILIVAAVAVVLGFNRGNWSSAERSEEPVILTIANSYAGSLGKVEGWLGQILLEELNVEIEVTNDIDNADIIIWANKTTFQQKVTDEAILENGLLLEWDETLISTYGKNISIYLTAQMDSITSICNGKRVGFAGNATNDGASPQGMVFTISTNCEVPEKAMEFLDWMVVPENTLTMLYGPKDICWEIDGTGHYVLTDLGRSCKENGSTLLSEPYAGTFSDGYWKGLGYAWDLSAIIPMSQHESTFSLQ